MREEKRFHVFACHVRERKSQLRWPTRRPGERKRERETSKVFESEKDAREIKLEKCRGALRIDERTKLAIILRTPRAFKILSNNYFQLFSFNF